MERKIVALHALHYKIKSFTIYYITEKYFFIYIIIKLTDIFENISHVTAISPYYCVLQFSHHIMQQMFYMDMLAVI